MFLLVPAYPGCPGSKAVKRSSLLLLLLYKLFLQLTRCRLTQRIARSVCGSRASCSAYWQTDVFIVVIINVFTRAMLCGDYLWPCVLVSLRLSLSGLMSFLMWGLLSTSPALCFKEIQVSTKIRVLTLWNVFLNPGLRKFRHGILIVERFNYLARERWTLRA